MLETAAVNWGALGAMAAVVVAVMVWLWNLSRQIAGFETSRQLDSLKIDTLWEIYGVDAIREARETGLSQRHSPDKPTEQWDALIPQELHDALNGAIMRRAGKAPEEIAIEVWKDYRDQLREIAEERGLPSRVLYGMVLVLCQNGNIVGG